MSDRQEENRQVVEKHVSNMLADMGDGELAVVYEVCNRLALGRQRYGSIDPFCGRDWRQDFREELLDALVYDIVDGMSRGDS